MTYRLRPTVRVTHVPEGLIVRYRNSGLRLEGGPATASLFHFLAPLLRGGANREDLLAAVPPRSALAVSALLEGLMRHGMLVERVGVPTDAEERFADTLSHLEAIADSPYTAFSRLRSTEFLIEGAGPATNTLARLLAAMGARSTQIRPGADGVMLSADPKIPLLRGATVGGLGLLGQAEPVRTAIDRLGSPGNDGSAVLASLVSNLLALHTLNLIANNPGPPGRDEVMVIRGDTLTWDVHAVPGRPLVALTPPERLPRAHQSAMARKRPRKVPAVLGAATVLTDELFGALSAPNSGTFSQLPLNVACTYVGGATTVRRAGFGTAAGEARYAALTEGLRVLASHELPRGRIPVWPIGCRRTASVSPSRTVMAVGRSYGTWVADGLCHLLLDRYGKRDPSFGFDISPPRQPAADAQSGAEPDWLRILAILGSAPVQVAHATSPMVPGFCTGIVLQEHVVRSIAAARTPETAIRAALAGHVARVQAAREGLVASEVCMPATDLDDARFARETVAALRRGGWTVVVHPLQMAQPLRATGLLIGPIGLVRGEPNE